MLSFVVRWLLAGAVLGAAVALVVHFGSATRQTLPWVTVGTGLVMAAWIGMSILFGVYVTYVANYGSVFGNLATFFVLLLYVYASSIAFLAGVQADACLRRSSAPARRAGRPRRRGRPRGCPAARGPRGGGPTAARAAEASASPASA